MKQCHCEIDHWTFNEGKCCWERGGSEAWYPNYESQFQQIEYCNRCGDMLFDNGMVVPTTSQWEYEEVKEHADVFKIVINLLSEIIEPDQEKRDKMVHEKMLIALDKTNKREPK